MPGSWLSFCFVDQFRAMYLLSCYELALISRLFYSFTFVTCYAYDTSYEPFCLYQFRACWLMPRQTRVLKLEEDLANN